MEPHRKDFMPLIGLDRTDKPNAPRIIIIGEHVKGSSINYHP